MKPIIYQGKEYYNRRQLEFIGITKEEIYKYFKVNKTIIDSNGFVNKIVPVYIAHQYLEFRKLGIIKIGK